MTKRSEAKYKIDRRMGQNIWGRPKSPVNRREYGPGQHGQRRKGKLSDFGVQLRAKQKLKGYYANISERQFKNIYYEAIRRAGDTSEHLVGLLESRLDAVVYRAKFVPTVHAARQHVIHGGGDSDDERQPVVPAGVEQEAGGQEQVDAAARPGQRPVGGEHRQEPRSVREGGDTEQQQHACQGPQRV